jgi:hypothetical protein
MHLVRRALPGADLMRRADEVMLRCMSPDVARNGHAEVSWQCPLLGEQRKTFALKELFRF